MSDNSNNILPGDIIKNIYLWRKFCRLTREKLSQECKNFNYFISPETIKAWENGKRVPRGKNLIIVLLVFQKYGIKLPEDVLMILENHKTLLSPSENFIDDNINLTQGLLNSINYDENILDKTITHLKLKNYPHQNLRDFLNNFIKAYIKYN